jgi:hypothetical protein
MLPAVASTSPRPVSSYTLLRSATALYARTDQALAQLLKALRLGAEGVLTSALTTAEKTDLTIALYSVQTTGFASELTAWEKRWYAQELPAAPSRLLLAAAGFGRELLPLCAAGYTVDAFEPAESHLAILRARAGDAAETVRGSFSDLVAAVSHGGLNALSQLSQRRYDAVILGWGSFTHVLEHSERRALLRACDRLAGQGPILASFWLGSQTAIRSRALTMGTVLGRRLASLRGISASVPPGQVFRTHCGFAHEFTAEEIEALAADCGRRVRWGQEGYPHVALLKTPAALSGKV